MLSYLTPGYPLSLFKAICEVLEAELVIGDGLSGPAEGDDPLTDGRADLAWVCSTSFVDLARRPDSAIRLAGVAWAPANEGAVGRPLYHSDVVVRSGATSTDLDDLRGRRIACNDRFSMSGYHALRIELARAGHDQDDFAELVMSGSHRRSVEMVLAGEIDAAVVDGLLLAMWRRDEPRLAGLRTISRLGPWPTQPLIAAERLGIDAVDAVQSRLIRAGEDELLRHELARAGLTGFVRVGDDHYAAVDRAMREV
ncbi:MAG: PhnD/SsuA/transferrin family substrate-binding protein [Acidimicrobiia bacterium]|nr:PhnD/SsuA/transferrin family substrate-binding protein [Acidimicrobiia bacterium]